MSPPRMHARWLAMVRTGCGLAIMLAAYCAAAAPSSFAQATNAFYSGDFSKAAGQFRELARNQPAAGTLQNLGLAEWQAGRRGAALLAWEQSLWINPFNAAARENLRYARKSAQLEAPEYTWQEAASMWLPVNAWASVAGVSLWFAAACLLLPRILRWRRAGWHQALAAAGFAVFLLCLPSLYGVHTRTRIGFVMQKDSPLRLTPTRTAQSVMLMPEGQPIRCAGSHGEYVFILTRHGQGWVERSKLGLICPE